MSLTIGQLVKVTASDGRRFTGSVAEFPVSGMVSVWVDGEGDTFTFPLSAAVSQFNVGDTVSTLSKETGTVVEYPAIDLETGEWPDLVTVDWGNGAIDNESVESVFRVTAPGAPKPLQIIAPDGHTFALCERHWDEFRRAGGSLPDGFARRALANYVHIAGETSDLLCRECDGA